MSSFPTTGALWAWPDGLYMLLPVFISWALWALVFSEHVWNLASEHDSAVRFQALFCRIILIFPLAATLIYLSAAFPWITYWSQFCVAIFEAYALVAFYALILGLAYISYSKEAFKKMLMASDWTNKVFVRCGAPINDPDKTLVIFHCLVIQFLVIKPLMTLIVAISQTSGTSLSKGAQGAMKAISVISMILSLLCIFRMYKCLSKAPGNPLENHSVFWKFMVIKLLSFFLIVNSILIDPLVEGGAIPVDNWLCTSQAFNSTNGSDYCYTRLIAVIFICEIVILTIPACFSYRHHKIEKLRQDKEKSRLKFIFWTFVTLYDLRAFIVGEVVNDTSVAGDDSEKKRLLDEINLQ